MEIQCVVRQANGSALEEAASRIKSGQLVGFPTETVYGLGASALDDIAVQGIFSAKKRPFSDPLIVHVDSTEQALNLLSLEKDEKRLFEILATEFWPGPLTIIGKAASNVSQFCTGGTGYLGTRLPSHPIARNLIRLAAVPIAAPSANLFGHVSPTEASHVFDDFFDQDVLVLDGGKCVFGIESTVIRIESKENITILRRGAIVASQLKKALIAQSFTVQIKVIDRFLDEKEASDSPGNLLKHYSPNLPAFMITSQSPLENEKNNLEQYKLGDAAFIDFAGQYKSLAKECLCYFDLSPEKNVLEACRQLFSTLRFFEEFPDVKVILLPDLSNMEDEISKALFDRIVRSCSGNRCRINYDSVQVCV